MTDTKDQPSITEAELKKWENVCEDSERLWAEVILRLIAEVRRLQEENSLLRARIEGRLMTPEIENLEGAPR